MEPSHLHWWREPSSRKTYWCATTVRLVRQKLNQLKFVPAVSNTTRRTCDPVVRPETGTVTVDHPCQPLLNVKFTGPVRFTAEVSGSMTTWTVFVPATPDASLKFTLPGALVTLTVYSTHSPADVHPTSKPPPVSVLASMSTPSLVRYWPPWLA